MLQKMKRIGSSLFFLLFFALAFEGKKFLNTFRFDPLTLGMEHHARYQVRFEFWGNIALNLLILPLLLAAYFAHGRIKSWFGQGRLRVDWAHLLVLALLPLFFMQGLPFIWMMTGNLQLFSLLVLYNLLSVVYKEPLYLEGEPPTVQPPNP